LVESWLAVPEMLKEAMDAIGEKETAALPAAAAAAEDDLIERSTPGFEAFATLVEESGHVAGPADAATRSAACPSASDGR
jgi:hypothetical protein